MSDENFAGETAPGEPRQSPRAFDWLRESHEQLTPSSPEPAAPQIPPAPPLAAQPPFAAQQPVAQPPVLHPPAPQQPVLSAPVFSAPAFSAPAAPAPVTSAPISSVPASAVPAAPEFVAPVPSVPAPVSASGANYTTAHETPLIPRPEFMSHPRTEPVSGSDAVPTPVLAQPPAIAPSPAGFTPIGSAPASTSSAFPFAGLAPSSQDAEPAPLPDTAFGGSGLRLERRESSVRPPRFSPLDIVALVLAIVLPPIGLVASVIAIVLGNRSRGFASGLAKAALTVAIVLTLVVGVGGAVLAKVASDQAAHNATVASSAAWCSKLQASPGTLQSSTFDWPAPADTIPDSLTSMASYVSFWKSLVSVAPSGIKAGTTQVESTANSIYSSVKSSQTLNNSANVSQMQDAASASGVSSWASEYCH